MKNGIITALFLILLSAVFYGCEEKKEEIQNRTDGWTGVVSVHLLDNDPLQEACKEAKGCIPPVYGFSGFDKEGNCIIFAQKPKYVDDNETLTLGHELEHCMFGAYHEVKR